ncbi:MAG: gamma-glutamyl-gamma-aminobutyrate hydrolase family protein, partial [Limosilactobacillus sp.]|nr:gamma-glutamyl-gamma-aminobutyrate hydrolase family protein [Limosilactobacillus sp.]
EAGKQVAPGLKVSAWADDQVVEAIESVDSDQILAVQWHPENMYKHNEESQLLFKNLIERSARTH